MNDFMKMKKGLIRDIKRIVKPLLYDSGYRKALDPKQGILGPTRYWRIWSPLKGDKSWKLKGGFVLTEFIGISEDGPMTDAYGHGCCWVGYDGLPVEDLYRLRNWLINRMAQA